VQKGKKPAKKCQEKTEGKLLYDLTL